MIDCRFESRINYRYTWNFIFVVSAPCTLPVFRIRHKLKAQSWLKGKRRSGLLRRSTCSNKKSKLLDKFRWTCKAKHSIERVSVINKYPACILHKLREIKAGKKKKKLERWLKDKKEPRYVTIGCEIFLFCFYPGKQPIEYESMVVCELLRDRVYQTYIRRYMSIHFNLICLRTTHIVLNTYT